MLYNQSKNLQEIDRLGEFMMLKDPAIQTH